MTNEQRILENLTTWGNRNTWAAKVARQKLHEYQARNNRDVLTRRESQQERRAA